MSNQEWLRGIHYDIMARCYNPKKIMYSKYGGRGIAVFDEWHNYEAFKKWALDNGYRPGLRLERIDSNKGYAPENCRFGEKYKRKAKNLKRSIKPKPKVMSYYEKSREKQAPIANNPLYGRYHEMRMRCENPKNKSYKWYGGRGISVCDEWRGRGGARMFIEWSMKNGYEENLTLERIDNNGNYSPDNCRWATILEQQNNRRGNRLCLYMGEKATISEIARKEGIPYEKMRVLLQRLGVKTELVQ